MRKLWLTLLVAGCASHPAPFEVKDATFVPSPGDVPRVFLRSTPEELPDVPMRSVGIITVPAGGDARSARMAADRGRELGCWIVVEHERFSNRRAQSLDVETPILLACAGPHVRVLRGPAGREFDCVIRGTETSTFGKA